jgi:6-phosphogluconolactonase
MEFEILNDADAVARRAADILAADAREAVQLRGQFNVAVSGGHTPWVMLRNLADEDIPWEKIHVFQIDERIAPAGDPDRNLTHLRESLLEHAPIDPEHIHPMPVDMPDPQAAADDYQRTLRDVIGNPPILDVAHLGMGPDGHTASLVPGDPALTVMNTDVALTGVYMGRRRVTLTYPILNRSRRILFLITGKEKDKMLSKLLAADSSIPSGRIRQDNTVILADRDAADQAGAS